MEYSPPPLFKQGASARVKVVFFSFVAIMLLVIDARLQTLHLARQIVGSALYPLQMLAVAPRDMARNLGDYFTRLSSLEYENSTLKKNQLMQSLAVQQDGQLRVENAQLRKLLSASETVAVHSILAEILYDARDSFTRRIILNRGLKHGVALGQPVIDDQGVVGQITRVFPLTAEVTLLTDKDHAIPVQVQRNGLRSVIYGKGQVGNLELRVPSNADIKVGDILVTSGIDGIYPAGLMVARATVVENNASTTFERIACLPIAGLDRHKDVLILMVDTHIEARPDEEDSKPKRIIRRVTRDSAEVNATPATATKLKEEPKPETRSDNKEGNQP
jgi:rod shape-determining protein MreC